MSSLFDSQEPPIVRESLEEGAVLLHGFASAEAALLTEEVSRIALNARFRHLVTPGGYPMSVAITNCGRVGWVSDRTGYRYQPTDPETGRPWAPMPEVFRRIALLAAAQAEREVPGRIAFLQ